MTDTADEIIAELQRRQAERDACFVRLPTRDEMDRHLRLNFGLSDPNPFPRISIWRNWFRR